MTEEIEITGQILSPMLANDTPPVPGNDGNTKQREYSPPPPPPPPNNNGNTILRGGGKK